MTATTLSRNGYAEINGIRMYYEIHGEGTRPLVLVHGGGSTIRTTFGNILPHLSGRRKVIAMELQAHGRTGDRDAPLSFSQDADDIAALLHHLKTGRADFLGFSNGGQTLIELALRHPGLIGKMIICSAFYKRDAVAGAFWEGFENVRPEMMPEALREGFLSVNDNEEAFLNSFYKDVGRMKDFRGWTDEQVRSIGHPVLIINGNHDVGSVEHAVEMYRAFPDAQLLILPGGHGACLGTAEALNGAAWQQHYVADIIETFLQEQITG